MTTWYHGTPIEFEAFEGTHLGKGTDQLGSGFYFTNMESTARGYALKEDADTGRIIAAELDIKNPMPVKTKFPKKVIIALLERSPDFEDALTNFGDADFEGRAVVIKRAVDAYVHMNDGDDALYVLNTISNDFWRGHEASFLRLTNQLTGYDSFMKAYGDEIHAVAWLPEQIRIIDVTLTEKMPSPSF